MTQRKYRDVTADDIGKRIEVTDGDPKSDDCLWISRVLFSFDENRALPFRTNRHGKFEYARIEVKE